MAKVGWKTPTLKLSVPGSREGVAIGYHSTCSLEAKRKKEGSSETFSTSGSVEKTTEVSKFIGFPIISSMASCDHPGNFEDDHLLGVHRHFRQPLSPLQLRCLSSVSNFSTSCHCQQSQGCCQTSALNFHPLHMFTTYHGT